MLRGTFSRSPAPNCNMHAMQCDARALGFLWASSGKARAIFDAIRIPDSAQHHFEPHAFIHEVIRGLDKRRPTTLNFTFQDAAGKSCARAAGPHGTSIVSWLR